MKNILSAYGIPTETVEAIMIIYRETKSMVRSPDGDTPYFEYVYRKSLDDNKHLGLTI